MLHVRDLLAQVFVAKGYHVEEGPMGGLLAKAPGETLLVEWKGDGPATSGDVRALSQALAPCGAHRAVLIAPAGAPAGVVHEATHLKIETWPLSRIALEIGLTALEAARGAPVDPAPAEIHPVAAPAPAPAPKGPKSLLATAASVASSPTGAVLLPSKPREIKNDSRPLPSAWDIAAGTARVPSINPDMQTNRTRTRTVVAEEKRDAELVGGAKVKKTAAVKAAPTLPENATLRVLVDQEAAAAKAGHLGRLQTARLALIPHVAFDFDCHVEHEALPAPIDARGTLLVHTQSGNLREVPVLDLADAPEGAERQAGRLTAIDVYDKVKSHLLRQTTREVKVEKEVGGVTVMGNERIGPSLDELGLAHRGIVHVPVWRIVGERGTAEVDAVSGDLLPSA